MKISIVYFTKTNVTGTLAKSIIDGIREKSSDIKITEHVIASSDIVEGRYVNEYVFADLLSSDAIIMGSPTYMGSVSAQFKAFADASSVVWNHQAWANKLAAGFTSGTALNGEQSSTLIYLTTLANQHGMLWVGLDLAQGSKDKGLNRLGCQFGVVAESPDGKINEVDISTAKYLGDRVASLVLKMS